MGNKTQLWLQAQPESRADLKYHFYIEINVLFQLLSYYFSIVKKMIYKEIKTNVIQGKTFDME